MGDWLEEITQEFPDAFFEELDGGIQLEEQALPDPEFPPGEMYIMGEYCHDMLGRYIVLYYGSFAALLANEDEETWKDEIFATVGPTSSPHHMEDTAGLHAPGRQGRGVSPPGPGGVRGGGAVSDSLERDLTQLPPGGGGAAGAGVRRSGAGRRRFFPPGLRAGGVPGLPPDRSGLQPQFF